MFSELRDNYEIKITHYEIIINYQLFMRCNNSNINSLVFFNILVVEAKLLKKTVIQFFLLQGLSFSFILADLAHFLLSEK